MITRNKLNRFAVSAVAFCMALAIAAKADHVNERNHINQACRPSTLICKTWF